MNGMLRAETKHGAPVEVAVAMVIDGLRAQRLTVLDIGNEQQRANAVTATVEVGLRTLLRQQGPEVLDRFLGMAVFPEDVEIPFALLEHCWGTDSFETHALVDSLFDQSLVEQVNASAGTVRLSSALHGYLRDRSRDELPARQRRLLDGFLPERSSGPRGWHSLADTEGGRYLWANLAHHLKDAGLMPELVTTVTDLRYVVGRAFRFGPGAVESDLIVASESDPANERVLSLQALLRRFAHRLIGFSRASDLAATLLSYLRVGNRNASDVEDQLTDLLEPPFLSLDWWSAATDEAPPLGFHVNGSVTSVESDAMGRRVVSGGDDGTVRVWDTHSGQEVACLRGHDGRVNAVRIDPNGSRVVSGGADGSVRLWDVESRCELFVLLGHMGHVNSVGLDRSGARIVSGGADRSVRIWEPERDPEPVVLTDNTSYVNSVRMNPSGTLVISGAADGAVRLWDVETGRVLAVQHGADPVNSVGVDRAGRRLVSGGADHAVRLWDAASGNPISVGHHGSFVNSVAFNGSGSRVASGGAEGTVCIWDAHSGALVATKRAASPVTAVALDDTGSQVVWGAGDGTVWIFVPALLDLGAEGVPPWIKTVSLDAGGSRVVIGGSDGRISILQADDGRELAAIESHSGEVNCVYFDPTGQFVVSGGADGQVRVVDWKSGDASFVHQHHMRWVNSVSLDGQAQMLASGGADGTIRVVHLASGDQVALFVGHGEDDGRNCEVNSVDLDPSGTRLVSAGADRTVRLWDLASGEELHTFKDHRTWVNSVCFDPNGNRVASAGFDGTIRIWDIRTGALQASMPSPTWITCVVFDDSGQLVASAGGDGALRVWNVDEAALITTLKFGASVFTCAWGPDGRIAVGTGRGLYMVRFVNSRPPLP